MEYAGILIAAVALIMAFRQFYRMGSEDAELIACTKIAEMAESHRKELAELKDDHRAALEDIRHRMHAVVDNIVQPAQTGEATNV